MIEDGDDGPVSTGRGADPPAITRAHIPADLRDQYEFFSYRNAAAILATSHPDLFDEVLDTLRALRISAEMVRVGGGNKGPIAHRIDALIPDSWVETRIAADLHVRLLEAGSRSGGRTLNHYTIGGYLDGHRIDFLKGRVAFDVEWNSKDQTYDRDLYAFSAFYEAGAIDVGIILTRGTMLKQSYFKRFGKVLGKDGADGRDEVHRKFGASTTWMGKLLYRLDAGRNGGCPVLAIGITPARIG